MEQQHSNGFNPLEDKEFIEWLAVNRYEQVAGGSWSKASCYSGCKNAWTHATEVMYERFIIQKNG